MLERTLAEQAGVRRTVYATLAALEIGDPAAPVALLVPGFTGSKEDYLPVLPPLAEAGYRVVAVDQRGQFESPSPALPEAYRIPALAADLRAVVADLGGGPAHLVGHSFGGLVIRAAAIDQPTVAASLTLLGSGPGAITGPRAVALRAMRPVLERGGVSGVWAAMRAADQTPYLPEMLEFLRRRFFASSPVGLREMGEQLLAEPDRVAELAAVLSAAGVPVLVSHGAADDAWAPAIQAEMAGRLGARYEVIDNAQHSPAAQNPAGTAAVLARFWSDIAAQTAA
jgi:pimeloyl-ACP methyl ester carboxylesterase